MDKIEIGDYVRTTYGEIHKVVEVKENTEDWNYYKFENNMGDFEINIVKHSKNIIDLIEAGDVLEIDNEKYEVIYDESYKKLGILIPSRKNSAVRHSAVEFVFQKYKNVSILTHEQYEKNCYNVYEE